MQYFYCLLSVNTQQRFLYTLPIYIKMLTIEPDVDKHRASLSNLWQHYFDGRQILVAIYHMDRWGFAMCSRVFVVVVVNFIHICSELLAHSFQFDARLSGFWKANGLEINKISILFCSTGFSPMNVFFSCLLLPVPGLWVLIFIAIEWGFLHCHHNFQHPNYCLHESDRQNRQSLCHLGVITCGVHMDVKSIR